MYLWLQSKKDSLQHYVRCKIIWPVLEEHMRLQQRWTSMQRLGIERSSHEALTCVALAFEVFHCLRGAHLELIKASQDSRSYEELHLKMRAVVAAAVRQLSD